MKKLAQWMLAFGVVAFAIPTMAANTGHAANLTRIDTLGDGRIVLQFDVDNNACPDTNNPKGYYVAVGQNGVTADGIKNILATAMLALSLGKPLTIYFDSATAYCYV